MQLGHHEEPQVSSHLLASVPDHTFSECFDEERDPFFWRLTAMSSRISGGRYALPDRPGFGIELDWDYVRAHNGGDARQFAMNEGPAAGALVRDEPFCRVGPWRLP